MFTFKVIQLNIFLISSGFSIMVRDEWDFPHQSKNDQILSSKVSPSSPNFYSLPIKVLILPPYVTWNGALKPVKKSLKNQKTKWATFQGNLKKFSACGVHFYKNWQFMTMKACNRQKFFITLPLKCNPPSPPKGELSPYWVNPNGKPWLY